MENVLVGSFENGRMKEARKSKIIAERCHLGIKEIEIAKPKHNSAVFKSSQVNTVRIGKQPTLMDPFEQTNVYLNVGEFGDTMFAKKNFSEGDLILYYSGLLHNKTIEPYLNYKNTTMEEM
jgi:hypothetical protein